MARNFAPEVLSKMRDQSKSSLGAKPGKIGKRRVPYFALYSTAPDDPAFEDPKENNSKFTASLVQHIGEKGLSLAQLAQIVSRDVAKQTRRAQLPWDDGPSDIKALQLFPAVVNLTPRVTPQPRAPATPRIAPSSPPCQTGTAG